MVQNQVNLCYLVLLDFKDEKLRQDKENIKSNAIINDYSDFVFFNRFGNVQHQGTLNKALGKIIRDADYDIYQKF